MENIPEDVMDFGVDDMEMEALGHDDEMEENESLSDLDEGIGGSVTSIDSMEMQEDLSKGNFLKRRHEEYDDPCDLEIKKLKLEEKN
ncbi:hypothetical protein CAEBREN_25030 [Caenorhabditis brenneri]|uniref:Uncharacterized protein n=1 Tax=Caenorhabditis brenneri TaxID=135651 RepID=G0N1U5_CAEBE|nr:hypothetical protein CAEBREN_25030 [Caenorhabditis brenneri]